MPGPTAHAIAALIVLLAAGAPAAAAPVNKCSVNGQVSYQSEPCPSGEVRRPPTVQELNAREKLRRQAAAAATASAAGAATSAPAPRSAQSAESAPPVPATYRCDGRQYCSQMSSCAEARYFLAHCPGVQMDGDRNGIPCERQWCH